jgi:hypothetical protein
VPKNQKEPKKEAEQQKDKDPKREAKQISFFLSAKENYTFPRLSAPSS